MKTREILKNSIFVLAILVSVASWIYTNTLVEKLKEQEQKNISLWAEAMREIENVDFDGTISLLVYRIIQENTTIPVIMMTSDNQMRAQNLAVEDPDEDYLQKEMVRITSAADTRSHTRQPRHHIFRGQYDIETTRNISYHTIDCGVDIHNCGYSGNTLLQ